MKIILIDKKLGGSRAITLGRWSRALLSLCALGLPLGMLGIGYYIASVATVPEALVPLQDEVEAQNDALADLREEAERRLQSLSLTVAEMEARLVRLDAMGQRLTDLAGLDDGEFDFSRSPALGGPLTVGNAPMDSDFAAVPLTLASEMSDLEARIADREQQLDFLEAVLANRQLQKDLFLSGRPIRKGWMSSAYGQRKDPFTGQTVWHSGVDFAGKDGSDIVAVASGVVTWSGDRYGYGEMVEINHGGGYATRYAHNKENLVKVGDIVSKGQVIAHMGSSGRSTGPHVHYEVYKNGRPVDPASYVRRTRR
ncbi:MAG: M23 family metallopeptidase [Halieaceae bacterium]|nr:M23 family metallopeptidase [Halieaceae bacterium]